MSRYNKERYERKCERRYEIFEEDIDWIVKSINYDEFFAIEPEISNKEMERRENVLKQFRVGHTPLIEVSAYEFGLESILVKDESKNHFGTFKDRKSLAVAESVYPYFERYVLAITSGNYGYSLSHFLSSIDGNTILIVPEGLDERKAERLREKARLVPLNLEVKFYKPGELIGEVKDNMGLRGAEIIDATNFVIPPYTSIFRELDKELVARNEKLDYLLVPLGSGELFLAAVMHYRDPHNTKYPYLKESLKGKKKIIGVTTNNPDSMAEMIYAKYRPLFYLAEGGNTFEEQIQIIRKCVSRGKNKVEFKVVDAKEDEIKRAYEFCQNGHLDSEPSASIAFVPLQRYHFSPADTVVVINTGDGRRNFQ